MLRFASLIYNLRHLRSMFAEELLKIKLACLFAISSFRRFWKHQRRLRPSPVMIAETISLACFVLLVVVFCCVIKIYTMVKNIRPSRNERLCVDYARDNQRALPVEREPTFYFPQAERGARQHGIRNNATYSGSQAIRRQPQMNDERFGWQSKKNVSYSSAQLEFFFSSQLYIIIFCFSCLYVILCSPFLWRFPSRIHHKQLKSTGLETSFRADVLDAELTTSREIICRCMDGQLFTGMH